MFSGSSRIVSSIFRKMAVKFFCAEGLKFRKGRQIFCAGTSENMQIICLRQRTFQAGLFPNQICPGTGVFPERQGKVTVQYVKFSFIKQFLSSINPAAFRDGRFYKTDCRRQKRTLTDMDSPKIPCNHNGSSARSFARRCSVKSRKVPQDELSTKISV